MRQNNILNVKMLALHIGFNGAPRKILQQNNGMAPVDGQFAHMAASFCP